MHAMYDIAYHDAALYMLYHILQITFCNSVLTCKSDAMVSHIVRLTDEKMTDKDISKF